MSLSAVYHILSLLLFSSLLLCSVYGDSAEANLKVLYRSLEKCEHKNYDLGTCIRLKAVALLERALHNDSPVVINDYMSLTPTRNGRQYSTLENKTAKSEQEIEAILPESAEQKDQVLDEMIADKITEYLQTRSLQFTVPSEFSEGRGKKKKGEGGMYVIAAMGMGAMMIQLAMGKIALLAGKALLVGKMALLLSAIIGLKKLLGGSGGGESHQVVYATEHGGHPGGWGRSLNQLDHTDNKAHSLAYSAYDKGQL